MLVAPCEPVGSFPSGGQRNTLQSSTVQSSHTAAAHCAVQGSHTAAAHCAVQGSHTDAAHCAVQSSHTAVAHCAVQSSHTAVAHCAVQSSHTAVAHFLSDCLNSARPPAAHGTPQPAAQHTPWGNTPRWRALRHRHTPHDRQQHCNAEGMVCHCWCQQRRRSRRSRRRRARRHAAFLLCSRCTLARRKPAISHTCSGLHTRKPGNSLHIDTRCLLPRLPSCCCCCRAVPCPDVVGK
jgi:hypothetical protein